MPEKVPIPKHETSDASAPAAAWFGLTLFMTVVVVGFIIWWDGTASGSFHRTAGRTQPNIATIPSSRRPSPCCSLIPPVICRHFASEEDKALQSYTWLDRKAGIIRIPLERAKTLILQRGLPTTGTTMPLPGSTSIATRNPLPAERRNPMKGRMTCSWVIMVFVLGAVTVPFIPACAESLTPEVLATFAFEQKPGARMPLDGTCGMNRAPRCAWETCWKASRRF